jgi:TetR/AcrR family transcriptional regulator, cholesterol catabolism regulator
MSAAERLKANGMANTSPVRGVSNGDSGEGRVGQLLEIACRLFATRGYDGTSLRDIAEEAQITKAALYYHFPNKEALYQQILIENLETLTNRAREAIEHSGSATEKVRNFMLTSADVYAEDRHAWVAGSNAFWSGMSAAGRAATVKRRDRYERLLRACIVEGIAAGEFRKVDPALTGRLLLSTLNQLTRWHSPEGRLTPREVIEQYLEIILRGLQAPPSKRG